MHIAAQVLSVYLSNTVAAFTRCSRMQVNIMTFEEKSVCGEKGLLEENMQSQQVNFLSEIVAEYDINRPKQYDLQLKTGAKKIVLSSYDGEKVRVRLASDTLATLQDDFKLKSRDVRSRFDLTLKLQSGLNESLIEDALFIFIMLPKKYIYGIELAANAENIELSMLECDKIELDVKTQNICLENVVGSVEVNCNQDMNINCHTLSGSIEINQLSAVSRIMVPNGLPFTTLVKGRETSVSYEIDGKAAADFSVAESDNIIEVNGRKSKLVICTTNPQMQE